MRHPTYRERDYQFGLSLFSLRTQYKLTQSGLAKFLGVSRKTIVDWEAGVNYPSHGHLRQLIELCLQNHVFALGQEADDIRALWQVANQRTPLDENWLARLLRKPSDTKQPALSPVRGSSQPGLHMDLSDAPTVSSFYGRENELSFLMDWLLQERCRVVSILGMGGIGKTSLAARLVKEIAPRFEQVYWRSLRDAPPLSEWLSGAISFLSDQQVVPPEIVSECLRVLMRLLSERRCLLVLDNFETLFEPGQTEASYRQGLEGFGRLLRAVGETNHQSCLVLTSREAPPELAILNMDAVRTFTLGGLTVDAAQQMLGSKQLMGSFQDWKNLTIRFGGNGLALMLVGERIRELFDRKIGLFLAESGASSIFGGIRQLLAEQAGRTSAPEREVVRALAIAREPMRLADLLATLGTHRNRAVIFEALEALLRRSVIERIIIDGTAVFRLQPVVLEFVTERMVEAASVIASGQPAILVEQALIKAQARDYVRHSQELLIGLPILAQLKTRLGRRGVEQRLLELLEGWRYRPAEEQGYGPGNVVNLLRLLRGDLCNLDMSGLELMQIYLAEVDAQGARLVDAHMVDSVLAEAFSFALCVALSGDGTLLAAGTSNGQVWLWRVTDRTLISIFEGDAGQVLTIAFSSNGEMLASGGSDGVVRLWDVSSRRLLATLEGHTASVMGIAYSSDGRLLASSSLDGTIRLWEMPVGRTLMVLHGHTGGVWSVALSTDGRELASGGGDGTVRLWDTSTGQLLKTLEGHTSAVWGVALSSDSRLVASGSLDDTVRLWEMPGGQPLEILRGHSGGVWRVVLSADGHLLASSGADGLVRVWETQNAQPIATLQGQAGGARGMSLTPDGRLLASSSLNGTIRLWETPEGRPLATLQGHTGGIWRVALSADGKMVASSGGDGTIRLWEISTGIQLAVIHSHSADIRVVELSANGDMLVTGGLDGMVRLWEAPSGRVLAILEGHTSHVWALALSANGRMIASGGLEGTVRLWDVATRRQLATLEGHTSGIRQVALSSDGHIVASGSSDGTVRLWEAPSGRPLALLEGHNSPVWGVALSADGDLLASCDSEGMIRLWEAPSGQPIGLLEGHNSPIWGVALSADGHLIASGSLDGTVRLWEAPSGRPLATLRGHTGPIWGVSSSPDGRLIASGSSDGTVRLWDTPSGTLVRTLMAERRYERMDITGLTGITEARREALQSLGAVENPTRTSAIPGKKFNRHLSR